MAYPLTVTHNSIAVQACATHPTPWRHKYVADNSLIEFRLRLA